MTTWAPLLRCCQVAVPWPALSVGQSELGVPGTEASLTPDMLTGLLGNLLSGQYLTQRAQERAPVAGKHEKEQCERRAEAAAYLRERYAIPCSTQHLAKLAVTGKGPSFRRIGRYPIYTEAELDRWANERMTAEVSSTSELSRLDPDN